MEEAQLFWRTFLIVAGSLTLAVAIFFLTRELWCWYFKINERRRLLERIVEILEERAGRH